MCMWKGTFRQINKNSLGKTVLFWVLIHLAASLFLLCPSSPILCFSGCFSPWKCLFFCCLLFASTTYCCQVHSLWRTGGRTWHSDKGMLLSSAALKCPLLVSPEAFQQLSSLHFSGNMATILGAYIPFSWRKVAEKVQFEKMLKNICVSWGQNLWDNADLFMLTLFPEDPSHRKERSFISIFSSVPPDCTFSMQGREGTNNLKSWEGAEGIFQSQSTEIGNPYSS